jgi:LuxR family maltose regulon positive regulatory protein
VTRPRLGERLDRGAASAVTLISAPAGFGKTTLITDWLATATAQGRSVAWLSLDQRDNDPAVFWAYVVAALNAATPGLGIGTMSLLDAPRAPIDAVVSALLNDLQAGANDILLVLDDLHVIEATAVQEGLAFLLENLPARLHLVIASRADPALPLARLRARGDLLEIRAADLRFTADEAAAYLNDAMGLELTPHDVEALEARTEGWIAALQLAALSLQGRDDTAAFIEGFAGDDRYVVDYLVEEVLQRQSEAVREFLLDTSILGRMNGALCDAVTGREGGRAMLEALDRGNLFVVPLDDTRRWYRYHHLFADVLQARLLDERPGEVPTLHLRASEWHEREGDHAEAIRHALAGKDVERAANLIERAIPQVRHDRHEATMRSWLDALPDDAIEARPALAVSFAGVLLAAGDFARFEKRLGQAERQLDAAAAGHEADLGAEPDRKPDLGPEPGPDREPGAERRTLASLRVEVASYRAAQALASGDVDAAIAHARRGLDLVDEGDHFARAASGGLLAFAHRTRGDLDAACEGLRETIESLRTAGYKRDLVGCVIALAESLAAQGRLGDAMSAYSAGLRDGSEPAGAADMLAGMSELLCERGDLDGAAQLLISARDMGERASLLQNRHRAPIAMARLRAAEGDLEGAITLLDEAERLYTPDFIPELRPIDAMKARVRIRQGDVSHALDWAREAGLSVDDDLSYAREYEHITLARALLARPVADRGAARRSGIAGDVEPFLARLLAAAEAGARTGAVIEILVLQALAHQARGDMAPAVDALRRALTLAEPEGYIRVFVDEGPPMMALLKAAAKDGTAPDYVARLLSPAGATAASAPVSHGLMEPLSSRELDVLRLLATDLDGPDIARQLFVSLNTLRTHTKSIYSKLGVNNRRAAVRRAADLG